MSKIGTVPRLKVMSVFMSMSAFRVLFLASLLALCRYLKPTLGTVETIFLLLLLLWFV